MPNVLRSAERFGGLKGKSSDSQDNSNSNASRPNGSNPDESESTGVNSQGSQGVSPSPDQADSDNASDAAIARDLLSARPFTRGARAWRDKGWLGTIPLPAKKKAPPPTGWTGRSAKFPNNQQVSDWAKMAQYKKGNIGMHLGFPVYRDGKEWEIIGIDVDNYEDNGKIKEGAKQLAALELQFGALPRTYVSTARASRGDYDSGIRFYLVPRGLAFRGQVDKDIEVICKNHRFAVIWPSYNPKSDSQYCLYSPDAWAAKGEPTHEIPDVVEIAILPESWLDYLTHNQMQDSDVGIDMDLSTDEIEAWAEDQFNDGDDICGLMGKIVKKWKDKIDEEATSHDKIRDAHWEIVNLGAEGHTGWRAALRIIDEHWIGDVAKRNKRDAEEIRKELFRSRTNAFRKVKVKVDNATSAGGVYTRKQCFCKEMQSIINGGLVKAMGGDAGGLIPFADSDDGDGAEPPDELDHASWGNAKDPDEYERNDRGNAEFLCDIMKYKQNRIKFVKGYGWILWTDATPDRPARWVHDVDDDIMNRAFKRVELAQKAFAERKRVEAEQLWAQTGNITPIPANVKLAFSTAKVWEDWARRSGNTVSFKNAIAKAKTFAGVAKSINEINQSPRLLGVRNGTVELRDDGAHLRDAQASDYVTLNTGHDWDLYEGIPDHDPGKKLWEEYLDRFIPESRRLDYQTILGHTLIGGNPERVILFLHGGTSTGKSTMLRAIKAALGDYADAANLTIFGDHKLNPALAAAMPKRVVFVSEFAASDKLGVATIKRMTGNDMVSAELKGENVLVSGVPQFVPIVATNVAPEVPGADEALRKRLVVLLFDQRIDDKHDEKHASHMLEEHSSVAILSWLIDGYNNYRKLGKIPRNVEIEKITDEFASELDPVSLFVKEMVVRDCPPEERVGFGELFAAYQHWCDTRGIGRYDMQTQIAFSKSIRGLGFIVKKAKLTVGGNSMTAVIGAKLRKRARSGSAANFKVVTESDANKSGN